MGYLLPHAYFRLFGALPGIRLIHSCLVMLLAYARELCARVVFPRNAIFAASRLIRHIDQKFTKHKVRICKYLAKSFVKNIL